MLESGRRRGGDKKEAGWGGKEGRRLEYRKGDIVLTIFFWKWRLRRGEEGGLGPVLVSGVVCWKGE